MSTSEDLQDAPPANIQRSDMDMDVAIDVPAAPPLLPALHLQFLDLALDPLPNLVVRVSTGAENKTFTTDAEGKTEVIQAAPGVRLRIEVQRFDGSFKEIEDAPMPSTEATWNYISPQMVLETETQLHEGEPGQIEDRIPKATVADEGDRPTVATPEKPSPTTALAPAAPTTNEPKPHKQAAKQPKISGNNAAPVRNSQQASGRTAQGSPMVVMVARVVDWWNSWTLASINLWDKTRTPLNTPPATAPNCQGSKVPYHPSMLPKVQALIQFAEEQTEYVYGKGEGTAAIVAQMKGQKFNHEKGEKRSRDSMGRCYQYVRIALTRAGIVSGFLADKALAAVQESASQAGQPLLDKGFVDVTNEVPDARWAATGDVIVYSWSAETWAQRKKEKGANVANHGHIDIRSETNYISDFMPDAKHPKWSISLPGKPASCAPNYVNIRVYRRYYDPRSICRIRAFLACLREYETQAIKSDSDRYRALNTPLPASNQKSFNNFAKHPWSNIPKSSWAKGTSTASGAYQFTLETADGFITKRMLFDLEGSDMFSPLAQDRLAVMLMEEKGALPAVRKGDLDTAVNALLKTWASLPGASQNHGRKSADGKPMDMAYLRDFFAKALALELRNFGIVE